MVTTDSLIISQQFRGPPNSANGGYACGVVAARLEAEVECAIEVSLRAPPPLDTPMRVVRTDVGVEVHHDDILVASARRAVLDLDVPPAPSVSEAARAMADTPARWADVNLLLKGRRGVHPICFCCGDELEEGYGLLVQPGAVSDTRAAGLWTPHPTFAGADGSLALEFVWTALDCPGEFAWYERDGAGGVRNSALLARLTAVVHAPVPVGQPCIVLGWRLGESGRKYEAGTALYAPDGTPLAQARALWVRFDPSRLKAAR